MADRPVELIGPEEDVADAAGEPIGDGDAAFGERLLQHAVVIELEQIRLTKRPAAVDDRVQVVAPLDMLIQHSPDSVADVVARLGRALHEFTWVG